jgi:hypothetical protein
MVCQDDGGGNSSARLAACERGLRLLLFNTTRIDTQARGRCRMDGGLADTVIRPGCNKTRGAVNL